MPRKFNNVPPDERPNWHRLNEGQRRYAWEQYNLALVRRGLPINHPVPEPEGDFDIDRALENPHPDEHRVAEDLARDLEPSEPSAEEILGALPDAPQDAVQDIDESHFEGDNKRAHHQRDNAMADSSLTPSRDANPAKRTRLDFDEGEAGTSKTSLPGTAKDQAGGNNLGEDSVRPFRLPKPIISIQNNVQYFRKVHRFFTYGFAYKVVVGQVGTHVMTTPLAMIPWDWLHLYLNPSEFALLPNQSSVLKVKCTVFQRNVRIAFQTNVSDTQLATLNQNKNIIYGVGLNKKLEMRPFKITPTTGKAMIPSSVTPFNSSHLVDEMNNWYGSQANMLEPNLVVPRHQMGQPDVASHYGCLYYRDTPIPHDGWECLQTYINEADADATSGGKLVEVTYRPKIGLCKPHKKVVQRNTVAEVIIPRGSHNLEPHQTRLVLGPNGGVQTISSQIAPTDQTYNFLNTPVQRIEKSQQIAEGLFLHESPEVQPTLHVGVQPVYAITASDTAVNNSFTDTQALFEVVAEAWIDTNSSTFRPLTNVSNVKIGNYWRHLTGDVDYSQGCIDGLYRRAESQVPVP